MGQLDKEKAARLADSIHDAVGTTGDVEAQKAKLQATNLLLVEASTVTRNDQAAQGNVIQTLNEKLHQAGYHVEGYGSKGGSSYLLMRQLNNGKNAQATEVAFCPIAADGTVNMQAAPRDANGKFQLPGDVAAQNSPQTNPAEVPTATVPVPNSSAEVPGAMEVPETVDSEVSPKKAAPVKSGKENGRDDSSYPEPLNPAVRFIRTDAGVPSETASLAGKSAPADVAPVVSEKAPTPPSTEEVKWRELAENQRDIAKKLHDIAELPDAAARDQEFLKLDRATKANVLGKQKFTSGTIDWEARAKQFDNMVKFADDEAAKLESKRLRAAPAEAPAAVEATSTGDPAVAAESPAAAKASRFKVLEALNSPTAGRVAVGALSSLGTIAGIWQINAGAKHIGDGHLGFGSLQVLGGTANTGAGLLGFNTLTKNPYAWAAPMAMRLGGGANVIGGGLELYNGLKTGDGVQTFDGAVYTASGALMLKCATNPVGWGAAVAGASYGLTRLGMQVTGGDKLVTGIMDSGINSGTNSDAAAISKTNLDNLKDKGANVVLQSYEQIKASNMTSKDVSHVILGLHEEMQARRSAGKDVAEMQAEVNRLREIRGVLAQEERQALT